MTPTSRTQTYESFKSLAIEPLALVAKQPKFKIQPDLMFSMIVESMSFETHAETLLRKLQKVEVWAKKPPKFKVKPQPKNVVETYEANNLLYIRYHATIIDKGEGKKKIGPGNRPKNFPQIVKQIK